LALTFAGASGKAGVAIAEAVCALHADTDLPIAISWNAPASHNGAAYETLQAVGVPVYQTPARAIRALAAVWTGRRPVSAPAISALPKTRPARLLSEAAGKPFLTDTGITAAPEAVVHTSRDAIRAAVHVGYPVVAKLLSSSIDHKSELGGVMVGLGTAAEVDRAFTAIAAIPQSLQPALPSEGVLIQKMVQGGAEVILGARIDPTFGPVVMVGAGGIYAEVFEDVAFRIAPIDVDEAARMMAETKVSRILNGTRGKGPFDVTALAEAIAGLSRRIADPSGRLQEIEINPLFVMPPGEGVIAGDCVVRIAEDAGDT
ncbi:MAG: acetate--CoA ligase family protein, partial [Pseudomonadota bacterium]